MMKPNPILLTAVAALALGACTRKTPEDLPLPGDQVPQGPTTDTGTNPYGNGGVQGAAVPGSAADFRAVVMSDRVFFDTDQYDIDAQDRSVLDSQAAWLRQYPNVRVTVEGHADERGTREYNIALGERRANAAKNYLVAAGIQPARLTTVSYGKERPAALGSDEQAWAQNRRAVTVVPQ